MAEETLVDVDVSDDALFSGAMADEPANEPAAAAPEVEAAAPDTDSQPRDDGGRLASRVGEQPAPAAQQPAVTPPTDADGGQIPAWRLREEAENRRAAEARAQQFERELTELRRNPPKPAEGAKPETKPDPLLDPEGYEAYLERKVEAKLAAAEQARVQERGERSLQAARAANTELFDKAYVAAQTSGDQHLLARISQSRDPGNDLLKWYREREALRVVGDDPNAWFERQLADPAMAAKAISILRAQQQPPVPNGKPQPPVLLPPSLSRASPAGAALGGDDDVSEEGIWNSATSGMRR